MYKYGVFASETIAHAILESWWGKSSLSYKYNDYFGVKAHGSWKGKRIKLKTWEYREDNMPYEIEAEFRWYDSIQESIDDHGAFLRDNRRYRENGVFAAKSYNEQARAILRVGYATSPKYAEDLIRIIQMP